MPDITIPDAVRDLLKIVERLTATYAHCNKKFTLNGRLLGDIGEVLVDGRYDLKLYTDLAKQHDAVCNTQGRKVQIKATTKRLVGARFLWAARARSPSQSIGPNHRIHTIRRILDGMSTPV